MTPRTVMAQKPHGGHDWHSRSTIILTLELTRRAVVRALTVALTIMADAMGGNKWRITLCIVVLWHLNFFFIIPITIFRFLLKLRACCKETNRVRRILRHGGSR